MAEQLADLKFAVGDRVRLTRDITGFRLETGREGTVTRHDTFGPFVSFGVDDVPVWDDELELVEEAPVG